MTDPTDTVRFLQGDTMSTALTDTASRAHVDTAPSAPGESSSLAPGDLVDEREAAALLGLQVQTMRNWRWAGKPPRYRKIGRCVR